jgi:hypothetical protein
MSKVRAIALCLPRYQVTPDSLVVFNQKKKSLAFLFHLSRYSLEPALKETEHAFDSTIHGFFWIGNQGSNRPPVGWQPRSASV